jgi:phosphatidylserine/phosphatidylglycerophosphate/cardiolipin synthase-like enzyme
MRPRDLARGTVAAAAAIVLVTSTVTDVTAVAAGAVEERAVAEKVLQNNPDTGDRDEIHERLAELIRGAKDTEIMVATYYLNHKDIANELAAAAGRNVKLRILVDEVDADKAHFKTVKDAIANAAPGSWIKTCGNLPDEQVGDNPKNKNKRTSCMGRHIMHNKFFLFGKTGSTSDVVVQTSANLNGGSGTNMWNTAYITPNEWLFGKYRAYFDDLAASTSPNHGDDDYYTTFRSKHSPVSAKFTMNVSPRTSGNTFLDVLNKIGCHGSTSGGTDGDHRTIVRVAAAQIAGANGIKLAKRLWELDNQGCYVDIVADQISLKESRDAPKGALEHLLARPVALPPERRNYHGPEVREFSGDQCGVHQKNILIDGVYDGRKNQKVVITGSHNMNNKSPLYNDEVVLQINSAEVHKMFKEAFFEMRAGAAITWTTSKYDVEPKRDPHYNCKD